MYETKDLKILKIIQKAREFADSDLLNEQFVSHLLQKDLSKLSSEEEDEIMRILNSIINSKDEALLSKG
ncbi:MULTISPECIES: hypothetical protein [unclassified Campylobacter]|uniref:hypothetical protein n=1 Tax=unclassified Campylobacter TaxID=2593542 RepID=UPI001237D01C|nr:MULTISPECIES: hypothetical protein [unclassified Campylobacter]KAA6225447.1 hypothetical protein FMM55_06485 [Campylobacter sp. LR196d]KAA6228799.1 hypothetical protein FMM54_00150 [Campylobacter sp. LR185c]KAA6229935.1 hypothetical protein FMM57_00150 [Campylobacter sp. LR286c]KAA6234243.1 hypothetical protein FMM58_00130 [Campylobacter sp. LR291e]KAA6234461.1 hypothetical protein FMM56_00140 [Campylobacter sp. LR264d]